MTLNRRTIAIAAVALVAIPVLWFACWRPTPTPMPRDEQKTSDSLEVTKPTFDSTHTAAAGAITKVVTKIVRDSAGIARAVAEADRLHRLADSVADVASHATDSAAAWRAAYDTRTREATSLRGAVDTLTRDLAAAKDTLLRAGRQLRDDSLRFVSINDLNARMAKDLARADPPCRILWVAKCPSRKVVALLVVGADEGIRAVARNRKALGLP